MVRWSGVCGGRQMEDGAINTRSGEPLSDSGCWPAVDTTLHPADLELGTLEHLADVVDRARVNPHLLAQCHLRLSFPFCKGDSQHLADFGSVLDSCLVCGIALVRCPFEMHNRFAERLPPAVLAGGGCKVAVPGLDILIGRNVGMAVPMATGMPAAGLVTLVNPPMAWTLNSQAGRSL